jgi:hypothetical protein
LLPLLACPAKPEVDQAAIDIDLRRFVVNLDANEHAIGGEQPLVTIVVWSDYACAPCGRSWQVMRHLVEDYGDDVRVVFRAGTVPGFEQGERAAEAVFACCASTPRRSVSTCRSSSTISTPVASRRPASSIVGKRRNWA